MSRCHLPCSMAVGAARRAAAWMLAAVLALAAVTGHGVPVVPPDSRQREPSPHVPADQHAKPDNVRHGWTAPAATVPGPGGRMMRVPIPPKKQDKRRAVDIGVGHRVKRGPDWVWVRDDALLQAPAAAPALTAPTKRRHWPHLR